MLNDKLKWPLERFLKFNTDSSGKRIEVVLNGKDVTLTIKQFERLSSTFSMSGSERVYKIIDKHVESVV